MNNHTAVSYSAQWTFTGRSLSTCISSASIYALLGGAAAH